MRQRVGFLSYWGWGRGQSYVTLSYAKMLEDEYDIYILKQGENEIADEFKSVNANITTVPNYQVDEQVFRMWVTENKLDFVVLNEYNQWNTDDKDLRLICKELGVKCFGYLVLERLDDECVKHYDRILCPTISSERAMRISKIRNFSYAPFGIDLEEFQETPREKNEKFTFLHVGGFGGVQNRKNTQLVIEAFFKLNNSNTKLIVTTQSEYLKDFVIKAEYSDFCFDNVEFITRNLSRKELLALYYRADAVVLPSKWETIGIPILEAMAAGKPVITTDAPPMNEFVRPGLNGYLCAATLKPYNDISILAAEVDVDSLRNNMENVMNPVLYPTLSKNARTMIERLHSIEKCKESLKKIFRGEY